MKLSLKHQRFIEEYLVDGNATKAAQRAGYSKRTARVQGPRLLLNVAIRETVQKLRKEMADACGVTREDIVRGTMEVIQRCRKTGARYQPHNILRAYEFLARLNGLIVVKTAVVEAEPTRGLDFGDLPIPNQSRNISKPN